MPEQLLPRLRVNKPFARKIQILTVGEQRAKVMGKTKVASILKKKRSNKEHMAELALKRHGFIV